MDNRETLIEELHTLSARLAALRTMEGPEMLLPGRVEVYHSALDDAYAAYGKIETVVDALGQALDYQHTRLDQEVKKYGSPSSRGYSTSYRGCLSTAASS